LPRPLMLLPESQRLTFDSIARVITGVNRLPPERWGSRDAERLRIERARGAKLLALRSNELFGGLLGTFLGKDNACLNAHLLEEIKELTTVHELYGLVLCKLKGIGAIATCGDQEALVCPFVDHCSV
jgi:hypothetical protein